MPLFSFRRRRSRGGSDPLETVPLRAASPEPPPAALRRQSSGVAAAVQERLGQEVLRKLKLATCAEEKEDRDIVCSEVFADITGELNAAARGERGRAGRRGALSLSLSCFAQQPTHLTALPNRRKHGGHLLPVV